MRLSTVGSKQFFKKLAGKAVLAVGALLGCACENDRSAAAAALGAEVDYIVAGFYDIKIVLDYYNGVARIGKAVDYINELMHIRHVKTGGRLVKDVDSRARAALRQLRCKLHSLRLAAGQSRARLAELYIAKADIVQCIELTSELGEICKEISCFLNGHIKDFVDILALVPDIKRLSVIALALADIA